MNVGRVPTGEPQNDLMQAIRYIEQKSASVGVRGL